MSGLVALGDSITRGRGGAPALGVHPLSWAQWLAEALELPYLSLARDGARAADLVDEQLPAVQSGWEVATLYVGANDARSTDFDGAAFERDVATAAETLAECAERLVMLTIPLDLGRPRAGADVRIANDSIRRVAGRTGATVVALDDFRGPLWVLPDAVHPTSLGMVEIADRATRALGSPALPSQLAGVEITGAKLARYWPWYGRMLLRDWRRRRLESGA